MKSQTTTIQNYEKEKNPNKSHIGFGAIITIQQNRKKLQCHKNERK